MSSDAHHPAVQSGEPRRSFKASNVLADALVDPEPEANVAS